MSADLTDLVLRGPVLGLAAGLSPGPLTVLVISETMQHGRGAGARVALAPLVTDLPLIAASLFLLERLAAAPTARAVVALAGAAFLFRLGLSGVRFTSAAAPQARRESLSLAKGVAANFLNPNPYVFWLGVGAPILLAAYDRSWLHAGAFAVAFFVCIVGSKMLLAHLVDRSRGVLTGRAYRWVMRSLGLMLIGYAGLFVWDGVEMLGW